MSYNWKRFTKPKREKKSGKVDLESLFHNAYKAKYPNRVWATQVKFSDTRKFRLDFGHLASKVGVEIQGGIQNRYSRAKHAHATPKAIQRDYEKNREALSCSWIVFHLSTLDLHPLRLGHLIEQIEKSIRIRKKLLKLHDRLS